MQTVLDQTQIDALFKAQGVAQDPAPRAADDVSAFNFGCAGQISTEQMRAISLVNDQFARNVMRTLGAWLRTQTHVVLGACEQMPFGEFLARVPEPAYLCMLRLDPLGAVGLLELDLPLAMAAMELLLGGAGGEGQRRQVTDIEDAILASVMAVIVRELNAAWKSVGLAFTFDKRDTEGQVPRLMPAGERTLCVSFEMHFLGVQGSLNFCLPAVVLNTVHRSLLSMRDQPRPRFAGSTARIAGLLGGMRLPVHLRSQTVRLASRHIAALEVGMVLELPLLQHVPAELRTRGILLAPAAAAHRSGLKAAMLMASAEAFTSSPANPQQSATQAPPQSAASGEALA